MTDRTPVEKLSLATRKNIRDKYEAQAPELQAKVANLLGAENFAFHINPNFLYAYAEDRYAQENPGSAFFGYFNNFVAAVDKYTKAGSDEAAKEALRKVLHKREATIAPSEGVSFSGCEIKDGVMRLLFNPKYLGSNLSDTCKTFTTQVDVALDALGGDDLPVVTRRAIESSLQPTVAALAPRLEAMFGKPVPIVYDVKAIMDYLNAHKADLDNYITKDFNDRVPKVIGSYLQGAVDTLEKKSFGKDDMLKEAFLESADKGITVQVVDKLKHNTFNDCVFENSMLCLQTVTKYYGTNVNDCAKNVVDRL